MQLNIYVPKEKESLIEALHSTAKRTGRAKNELVLEALERYLKEDKPQWRTFHMGGFEFPSREEIYGDYEDLKYGRPDGPGR